MSIIAWFRCELAEVKKELGELSKINNEMRDIIDNDVVKDDLIPMTKSYATLGAWITLGLAFIVESAVSKHDMTKMDEVQMDKIQTKFRNRFVKRIMKDRLRLLRKKSYTRFKLWFVEELSMSKSTKPIIECGRLMAGELLSTTFKEDKEAIEKLLLLK